MSTTQTLCDFLAGREDVRDVRLFRFAQRRRHTNDDRVALAEVIEVCRRLQAPGVNHFLHLARRHVADVGSAGVDLFCLRLVDLETGGFEPLGSKLHEQRQADVAEADNADVGLFVGY